MTQTTKHTPGPWLASISADGFAEILHKTGEKINGEEVSGTICTLTCNLGDLRGGCNFPTIEANAHLIAAAPELYEALESVIRSYIHHCPDANNGSKAIANARTTLAKARGEG